MRGRQAPADARAGHPARQRGQLLGCQAKAGGQGGHFEKRHQLAHAAALLGQGQQPLHRVNQRAGGLSPQVGDVKGNEAGIAALVLAKHGADGRRHELDVGHHDHHVARRDLGLRVEPLQQLIVQHFQLPHRAVRHLEHQRAVAGAKRGIDRVLRRAQIADAVLQLYEQAAAIGPGGIVKQIQALARHALLRGLQVIKGVELADEVPPLPPPGGQQSRGMQVHLLKRGGRQVVFFVGVPPALGAQRIAAVHDVAPVVLTRVGHGQQHLAVRRQRGQHLQQLAGHVAHAKHRHASRHRAGQRLARLQTRQRPQVQGGPGGLLLCIGQSGQHPPPQLGLPQLVFGQLAGRVTEPHRLVRQLAQHITPFGPVLQPIRAVNLVLVKQVRQAAGQLQQPVGLRLGQGAAQKTGHGLEHCIAHARGQQGHQAPGHRQLVQR